MWHRGGRPAEPPIAHTSGVFWFLFHAEKELAPQGETLQHVRPQAAPTKGEERNSPRRAKPCKSLRPTDQSSIHGLCAHCPLIRSSVRTGPPSLSPLTFGHLPLIRGVGPPGGRLAGEHRPRQKSIHPWYPVRLPGGKISPKTAPGPMREGIKSKKAAQRPPQGGVETSGRSKNANFSRNFTRIFQGNPPL